MNLLAVAIIFGLVYPVYKSIVSFLMGNSNPDVKNARTEYVNEHPAASILGCIMAFAIPIAYWILVLIYFVL